MGNSTTKTPTNFNPNVPLKPALKKTTVISPTDGYKYYPTPHPPEQYFYPADANQNRFYSQSPSKNTIPQQQTPRYYDNQNMNSPQHRHHGRNHHHHHHHRSHPSSDKENFNSPIYEERSIPPYPSQIPQYPAYPPAIPPQKQVRPVVAYHIVPAVTNGELLPSPQLVQQSSSMNIKKDLSLNSTENPLSPTVAKQHETPQPTISKTLHSSLLVPASSFEKAPPLGRNYIAKSPDNHSLHNYVAGPLTIVRKSPLRHATSGNRWYDHDYDKRVKSISTSDVV